MVNRIRTVATPLLLLLVLGLMVTGLTPKESQEKDPAARAQPGDTVLVWLNFVKPDKVEQYEEFLFDILLPALKKTAAEDPERLLQVKQTRLLRPVGEDSEGVLSYVWLMDPVVVGKSYGFRGILEEVYSEAEAEGFMNSLMETVAKPQVVYRTTQTAW
ncbi:MAG: hypothetical protein JRJ24_13820 [Deltaproteobacteria bacterium]|nr:hypothetical protein [Deltaproteobacteria bacterium]